MEQRDPEKHALASREIKQCYERNKAGDPEYQSLHKTLKTRLNATVGDEYWRKAQSYLDFYFKQKQHDELLFKQPESSHLGDCPICCVPLPVHSLKTHSIMICCGKMICDGCFFASRAAQECPFCRATPETAKDVWRKRVEANDPDAMLEEGRRHYNKGEYSSAFEYLTKAAAMGDAEAHCRLVEFYLLGLGVEEDKGKAIHHLEEAAIGGHPTARFTLGFFEWETGKKERAVKHLIIAVTQGEDKAIKWLMKAFKEGIVIKDDLDSALRAYQAAVEATKSPQREAVPESEGKCRSCACEGNCSH